MADQSLASAPMSMSSSTWREGLLFRPVVFDNQVLVRVMRSCITSAERVTREEGKTERKIRLTSLEYVLEAHVKGCVGVGCEDGSLLAGDVSRAAVLVTDGISDLYGDRWVSQHFDLRRKRGRYCFGGIGLGRTCMLTV